MRLLWAEEIVELVFAANFLDFPLLLSLLLKLLARAVRAEQNRELHPQLESTSHAAWKEGALPWACTFAEVQSVPQPSSVGSTSAGSAGSNGGGGGSSGGGGGGWEGTGGGAAAASVALAAPPSPQPQEQAFASWHDLNSTAAAEATLLGGGERGWLWETRTETGAANAIDAPPATELLSNEGSWHSTAAQVLGGVLASDNPPPIRFVLC